MATTTDNKHAEVEIGPKGLDHLDGDDAQLADLGIGPSGVQRNFNFWSLLFMSFCTSVTWEAVSSAMAQALMSGGSSSMVWGFVVSACGAVLIALCIAEYASMVPTAGGQYHYVSELSPAKYRRIFSWYAGWITMIGWILSATAGIFATAMQIQSWAILFHDDYVFERWHTSLIVVGLVTFYSALATFDIKHLHHLMFFAMLLHVVGFFATSIYLLVVVNPKNTAEFVFTDTTNLSGWESNGVAWSIGLLSSGIGFIGWDSASHMAEEMKNPARDLPRAMLANIIVSAVLTFPWVIALMFCITDIGAVLSGPAGTISPLAQLYYNVSGGSQAVTVSMTMWLPLLGFFGTGSSIISATSRVIWAFARDGGLPESFARVSPRTKVPNMAIAATWFIISALSMIYIGNATAYYGIISACTVCLIISYAFPILVNVIWGFKHCSVPRGVFTLGRYHRVVAIPALAWCLYLTIFMCFPAYQPVTRDNMNYGSAVLGFGIFIATAGWFTYGNSKYVGVIRTVDSIHEE